MTLLQAILLGIVQGLTEFIPVSSTAHLVIAGRVMKLALTPEQLTASIAVIQLGTLIAVLIYFAGDIWNITLAFIHDHLALLKGGRANNPLSHDAWLGWLVIIGSIPVAVVGLLFKKLNKPACSRAHQKDGSVGLEIDRACGGRAAEGLRISQDEEIASQCRAKITRFVERQIH